MLRPKSADSSAAAVLASCFSSRPLSLFQSQVPSASASKAILRSLFGAISRFRCHHPDRLRSCISYGRDCYTQSRLPSLQSDGRNLPLVEILTPALFDVASASKNFRCSCSFVIRYSSSLRIIVSAIKLCLKFSVKATSRVSIISLYGRLHCSADESTPNERRTDPSAM